MAPRRRTMVISLVATTVVVVGLVVFAKPGVALLARHVVCTRIESALGVPFEVEHIAFSWRLDFATVSGIRLGNLPGMETPQALTIDSVDLSFEREGLFGRRNVVSRMEIRRPVVCVERSSDGVVNWAGFARALQVLGGNRNGTVLGRSDRTDERFFSVRELVIDDLRIECREAAESRRDFQMVIGHVALRNVAIGQPGGGEPEVMTAEIGHLMVSNPAGFSDRDFVRLQRAGLSLDLARAMAGDWCFDEVTLDALDLRVSVQGGRASHLVLGGFLREIAADFASASDAQEAATRAETGIVRTSRRMRWELARLDARDTSLRRQDGEGSTELFSGRITLRDFVFPSEPDRILTLDLAGHALVSTAEVSLHLEGAPHATAAADRFAEFTLRTDGLPIQPVMRGREVQPGLTAAGGTLESTTSGRLRGDLVDAFVTARFTDLQLENLSNATLGQRAKNKALIATAAMLKEPGTDRTVEIEFPLKVNVEGLRVASVAPVIVVATTNAAFDQMLNLGAASARTIRSAAGPTVENGKKIVDEAGRMGGTVVEKSRDAAGSIVDFLGGMFSGKQKEDEKLKAHEDELEP